MVKLGRVHLLAAALLCSLAFAAPPSPAYAGATPMDWSSVLRQVIPAVVNISIETISDQNGTPARTRDVGTGFLVDSSGTIVTNKHVIANAFRITVTLSDLSQYNAQLVNAAQMVDLAVLKINVGHPLPFLHFADSDKAEIGEPVILIGNPLGLGTSVSSGIVSAVHRSLMNTPIDDYIQTDAALNHGNSGGPMIDRDGNVLGVDTILVTNASGEGSNGLGFAIAGSVVQYAVRVLLHPDQTSVGWIGVHLQDVTTPLQAAFKLSHPGGFLVTEIDPGSPAAKAGLKFGDVITHFGDHEYSSARSLMRDIIVTPLNTSVPITFEREGKPLTANVTIAPWAQMVAPAEEIMRTLQSASDARAPDLGLILAPMSAAAQAFYKLPERNGVVVAAVDPSSGAYTDGVAAGDVLLAVGTQTVTSPDQAMRAMLEMKAKSPFVALLVASKGGDPRWVALYSGHMAPNPNVAASERPATESPATAKP